MRPNLAAELATIFNDCFLQTERTIVQIGGAEPVYLPADDDQSLHQIVTTLDYPASVLHEVSHWCLAGEARRKLVDYGYWYAPDGRTAQEQSEFERVEVKPQALEWCLSLSSGIKFRLSTDNVNNPDAKPSNDFRHKVWRQGCHYMAFGLPSRAEYFAKALRAHFGIVETDWVKTVLKKDELV